MATSLPSSSIKLALTWKQQATNTGGPTTPNNGSWNPALSYTNGGQTAAKANEFYEAIRTLTANSSETLDLTSGLTNLLNFAVDFTTIRSCLIWLLGASRTGPDQSTTGTAATHIIVGGASSNQAFTADPPNGFFGRNPVTVTAATHSNTSLTALGDLSGVAIGATVTGTGIQAGTTITAIDNAANTATLSQAATASATVNLTFKNPGIGTNIVANDGFLSFAVATALGFTVDSTHKNLKVANGDGAVSAKYVLALIGTNS